MGFETVFFLFIPFAVWAFKTEMEKTSFAA